ncbi:hypothetical protein QR680_008327 [Steinernema hermaphroditum]|uniref:Sodium/calcium exchanger membrane region domain-containing protein n=1 Tax=Steinernema hermaphroditum TaxID=289476 RepID=A0AA39IHL1_9BILA|nr:hypothetical protein QR680_008327 [Steinernema hermaphroditum]
MQNTTIKALTTVASFTIAPDDGGDEICALSFRNYSNCSYVLDNGDACEGGGYLLWTSYVICQETALARGFTIFGSVVFLAFLFLLITASADDFFSPNVSAIIDHLKISHNIAGITFMAFGNGAPDIFSSLAAVNSVKRPKAGLAVGELLGGGIFDSSVVVAAVVLVKPFHVMRRPIMRDIAFYLLAVAWTAFVFLYGEHKQMLIWMPIGFLVIYVVYALVVIIGRFVHQRGKRKEKKERHRQIHPTQSATNVAIESICSEKRYGTMSSEKCGLDAAKQVGGVMENGKFFYEEHQDVEVLEESTSRDSSLVYVSHAHNVTAVHELRGSEPQIPQLPPSPVTTWHSIVVDSLKCLNPFDVQEFADTSIIMKILMVFRIPIMIVLKCSTPLAETPWSKPIALLHAFTAPIFILFAFQIADKNIGPIQLWAYALMVSAVIATLIFIFTEFGDTPKYYKQCACYAGFVTSAAWMYFASSEVVDVVNMLGIMSGISHEVIGLTILAWSNSIGDLIADTSVARQGFPRMGISAAIGGPCFNLLIGFGFPFLIACAQGKEVIIEWDTVKKVMLIFLALSLLSSFILLPVQRFNARRPYALVLLAVYVTFLILVVLAEVNVYSF